MSGVIRLKVLRFPTRTATAIHKKPAIGTFGIRLVVSPRMQNTPQMRKRTIGIKFPKPPITGDTHPQKSDIVESAMIATATGSFVNRIRDSSIIAKITRPMERIPKVTEILLINNTPAVKTNSIP
jgi:hypothetical protein